MSENKEESTESVLSEGTREFLAEMMTQAFMSNPLMREEIVHRLNETATELSTSRTLAQLYTLMKMSGSQILQQVRVNNADEPVFGVIIIQGRYAARYMAAIEAVNAEMTAETEAQGGTTLQHQSVRTPNGELVDESMTGSAVTAETVEAVSETVAVAEAEEVEETLPKVEPQPFDLANLNTNVRLANN